jgi:hypothetical protein
VVVYNLVYTEQPLWGSGEKTGTPGFCIITLVGTLYLGRADKFFYGGGKKKYWGFLGKEGE